MKLNNIIGSVVMMGALLAGGCISVGTFSKVELRRMPVAPVVIVEKNFVALAEYWDEHAERYFIDLTPAGLLTLNRSDGLAEIIYGKPSGPFFGMIELHRLDDNRTEVRAYATKGSEKPVLRWRDQLTSFP